MGRTAYDAAAEEEVPVHIEMLSDSEDWQLGKLENGFLKEIGEEALTKERQEPLSQAVRDGKITFLWQNADTGLSECAAWRNAFLPLPAGTRVYLKIFMWNRCSARKALPENLHGRHKIGAGKKALQV